MNSLLPKDTGDLTQPIIIAKLLALFQRELEQTIRPELSSGYGLYVTDVMTQMLAFIADWAEHAPYAAQDAARAALIARAATPADEAAALAPAFEDTAGLDHRLEDVVARSDSWDASARAQLFADIGRVHDDLYTAQTRRHGARRDADLQQLAAIDIDLTPALFDRFARERMGIADDPTERIARIPGGNSKDTFLITLASGQDLIVRRDFPFGPTETSAPNEFEMLNLLRAHGMPVPRPLFAERDKAFLGQPALIVERILGENALAAAQRDPSIGRQVSLELAALLARLHSLPLSAVGLTATGDSLQDQVRAYIGYWRDWWNANRIHPSSLIEAGFAWLNDNIPAEAGRIVPVHGDARPDNMMYHDGTVAALLDWEFLHAGDASEDMQYAKGFVAPFVTWSDFLAAYRDAGGDAVTESSSNFYDVFRSLRNAVCVDVSWSGFVTGKYESFKLASQGVLYRHMISQTLAQSLKDSVR